MLSKRCQKLMLLALVLAPAIAATMVMVAGNSCGAGYNHRGCGMGISECAATTCCEGYSAKCSSVTTSQCASTCCEADSTKCSSEIGKYICGTDHIFDTTKYGTAKGNTPDAKKTNCCKAMPTCKAHACAAGFKKSVTDDTKCEGYGAECGFICCEVDSTKCRSEERQNICGNDHTFDTTKHGTAKGDTPDAKKTNCCKARPTCKSHACAAGFKKKGSVTDDTKCAGYLGSECRSTCCEADSTKCSSEVRKNICGNNHTFDTTKHGTAKGDTADAKKTNCCKANPTCKSHACAAGSKKKGSVTDDTKCVGYLEEVSKPHGWEGVSAAQRGALPAAVAVGSMIAAIAFIA